MMIEVILRLMMLTSSILLAIGSECCIRYGLDWWRDGYRVMGAVTLLIAFLALLLAALMFAMALFVDFC